MKKTLFIVPLAAALILSSCGKKNQTGNPTSDISAQAPDIVAPMAPGVSGDAPVGGGKQPMTLITLEEAKAAALEYAGLTEADVSFRDYEQELDDGRYEFEFTANGVEYEIYVAGGTGEVTWFETDKDVGIPNFPAPVTPPTLPTAPASPVPPTPVTPPDATTVAPTEPVNPVAPTPVLPPTTNTQSVISREDAKSIALSKAGLSEADIRDYDIELERGVYEIDFESGNTEFEFEIDASTGEILRYKNERD